MLHLVSLWWCLSDHTDDEQRNLYVRNVCEIHKLKMLRLSTLVLLFITRIRFPPGTPFNQTILQRLDLTLIIGHIWINRHKSKKKQKKKTNDNHRIIDDSKLIRTHCHILLHMIWAYIQSAYNISYAHNWVLQTEK